MQPDGSNPFCAVRVVSQQHVAGFLRSRNRLAVERAARAASVSVAILYRWLKRYGEGGIKALAPIARGMSQGSPLGESQARFAKSEVIRGVRCPFFATKQGRAMGYSHAILGAIRRVTQAPAILTGKLSLHALRFVARKLGVSTRGVAVVGHDPAVEIIMVRRGGATAFGVITDVMTEADWTRETGEPLVRCITAPSRMVIISSSR